MTEDVIDSHHHLWTSGYAWLAEPELAPIRRDYTVDDLRAQLSRAGVAKTVLVEAGRGDDAETTEFLALAAGTPEIAAVVGWADPLDPRLAEKLAAHRAGPGGAKLAGVRSQIQAESDPDFLARPDVIDGLAVIADAGLAFDLVIRAEQLPGAVVAARSLPHARLVLDHLGKPRIRTGAFSAWRTAVEYLAACPTVVAKLSGLVTEADWTGWQLDDLRPYAHVALEFFGPDRLLWGSDWPVVEVAGGYERWLAAARDLVPADLHPAVFAANAARTYGLD
ncbi:L-fuconolactonase [Hamadaea flava]|uniref:Amidohydrolase family protein n=1 Tax=Hamadaea flava TaxID=1742688 RepID=A0ABV8LTW0_9ACTN|nr:amidohydrolase family protein [Hamadaea flava]MCP2327692.1 L-fuconolactonase [Hamadaea flava]